MTRLPFIAIVGDVRDLSNPNYCAIGMMRAARMAEFRAEALCRKIFSRWAGLCFRVTQSGASPHARAAAEPTPQVPDPEHAPAQSSESDDEFDEVVGEEDSAERSDSLSCVITSERRQ